MSAPDELRQAAETLRNRALCASEGPWESDQRNVSVWADHGDCLVVRSEVDGPDADLDYIATMHPGVGLALSDWLDQVADRIEQLTTQNVPPSMRDHAERVARLINGGAA